MSDQERQPERDLGAVLVEDRVLDERASAPIWLVGCILADILYLVLDVLLDIF